MKKVSGPGSLVAAAVRTRSRPRPSSTTATSGRSPAIGAGTANRSHAGSARGGAGNAGSGAASGGAGSSGGGRRTASSTGLIGDCGFAACAMAAD